MRFLNDETTCYRHGSAFSPLPGPYMVRRENATRIFDNPPRAQSAPWSGVGRSGTFLAFRAITRGLVLLTRSGDSARGIPVNQKLVRDHGAKTLGQAAGFEGLVRMGTLISTHGIRCLLLMLKAYRQHQHGADCSPVGGFPQWPDGHCRAGRATAAFLQQLHGYGVVGPGAPRCICRMAWFRSVMRSCAARRNGSAQPKRNRLRIFPSAFSGCTGPRTEPF